MKFDTYCKKYNRFDLLDEFNHEKSFFIRSIIASDIDCSDDKKAFFKCKYGHEYTKSIKDVINNSGFINCPHCVENKNIMENKVFNNSSIMEKLIYYYVKKVFPNAESSVICTFYNKTMELDIFIKEYNLVIEHDGYLHNRPEKMIDDTAKSMALSLKNINVIRIRQNFNTPVLNDIIINYDYEDSKNDFTDLDQAIKEMFNVIKKILDLPKEISDKIKSLKINSNKDKYIVYKMCLKEFESQHLKKDKITNNVVNNTLQKIEPIKNSLQTNNPRAAREFMREKNNGVNPANVPTNTSEIFWFKCEACGLEYRKAVNSRHGNGPHCKNKTK